MEFPFVAFGLAFTGAEAKVLPAYPSIEPRDTKACLRAFLRAALWGAFKEPKAKAYSFWELPIQTRLTESFWQGRLTQGPIAQIHLDNPPAS